MRDFIILHYKATQRDDTDFWRHVAAMDAPESLERRIALFRAGGRFMRDGDELFSEASWVAVFTGQHILPQDHDPLADGVPYAAMARKLAGLRGIIRKTAEAMPTHETFIARCCQPPA